MKAYIHDHLAVPPVAKSDLSFFTDAMYLDFEERFRGSPDEIRERQRKYVPFVASSAGGRKVVDIGCGTGEWLDLSKEHGFDVLGIDTNLAAVERCRQAGHTVTHLDAVSFLKSTHPGALGAITMFQVIEHLKLSDLFDVLRYARTALGPGGLFLAEFPNIAVSSVGASTFWLDPTHRRPLHAELVQFLAQQAGFELVEIHHPSLMGSSSGIPSESLDVVVMAWA